MSKTAKPTIKIPLNLLGADAHLANKLRVHLVKKTGIANVSAIAVARLAYKALAEKEGITA